MIRISEALAALIARSPLVHHGLHFGLFNLSSLARFIAPALRARCKKEVSESAIVMALSRMQRAGKAAKKPPQARDFLIDNVTVTAGLCAVSLPHGTANYRGIGQLQSRVKRAGGFIAVTHGIDEVRIIIGYPDRSLLRDIIGSEGRVQQQRLAALGIRFRRNYIEQPGFFFVVFQQLYVQGINVVEVMSTSHELLIFVDEKDARLGFDTMYEHFMVRPR